MNNKIQNMMNMAKKSNASNSTTLDLLSSFDVVNAAEEEEFFYKENDQPVPEGDPVGIDIDRGDEVKLVLFCNIYWKPDY